MVKGMIQNQAELRALALAAVPFQNSHFLTGSGALHLLPLQPVRGKQDSKRVTGQGKIPNHKPYLNILMGLRVGSRGQGLNQCSA